MAISKSIIDEDEEWNRLPDELKKSIEEGLAQIERGEGISHEEFLLRFSKWSNNSTNSKEDI